LKKTDKIERFTTAICSDSVLFICTSALAFQKGVPGISKTPRYPWWVLNHACEICC